ncbi:hypothetical protein [Thiobacillus denitrificans]|uniref:hypothetical protein n=1 Tax=Thiobacillus denitrificans TaxID=36861 RepID=UPI000ACB7EC2|nr:hypothetical protein [Thiobacillus denitrificans]
MQHAPHKPASTNRFGLMPHWLEDPDLPAEIAADATRIDAFIAVFALGVILGWLIGGAA